MQTLNQTKLLSLRVLKALGHDVFFLISSPLAVKLTKRVVSVVKYTFLVMRNIWDAICGIPQLHC